MEAQITTLGHGRGKLGYADGDTLACITGGCITLLSLEQHSQLHWPNEQSHRISTMATHRRGGLLAYTLAGSRIPTQVVSTSSLVVEGSVGHPDMSADCVSLSFSDDGTRLLTAHAEPDNLVCLWSWRKRKMLASSRVKPSTLSVGVSICPSDRTLAAAAGATDACILRYKPRRMGALFDQLDVHGLPEAQAQGNVQALASIAESITCFCWLPGPQLLLATAAGSVFVAPVHANSAGSVVASRVCSMHTGVTDARTVVHAIALGLNDGSVQLLSLDYQPLASMHICSSAISCLAEHPQQVSIAVGTTSGAIYELYIGSLLTKDSMRSASSLLGSSSTPGASAGAKEPHSEVSTHSDEYESSKPNISKLHLQQGHRQSIVGAGMLTDQLASSVSADGSILLWYIIDGRIGLNAWFNLGLNTACACTSPTSNNIQVVAGEHGDIRLLRLSGDHWRMQAVFQRRVTSEPVEHLAFSQDGSLLAAASSARHDEVVVLQISNCDANETSVRAFVQHGGDLTCIAWLPTHASDAAESMLALGKSSGAIEFHSFEAIGVGNRATPESSLLLQVEDAPSPPISLCAKPEDALLLAAGADGSVYAIDTKEGRCNLHSKVLDTYGPLVGITLAGGRVVAVGSEDGRVTLLSSENLEVHKTYRLYSGVDGNGSLTGLWSIGSGSVLSGGEDGVLHKIVPLLSKKGQLQKAEECEADAFDVHVDGILAEELEAVEAQEDIDRRQRIAAERDQAAKRLFRRCTELSSKLNSAIEENEQAEKFQQLRNDELIVDTERYNQLLEQGNEAANHLRQHFREQNLLQELLRQRIRACTKDRMEVLSFEVQPFGKQSSCIRTYSMRKLSTEEQTAFRRVRFLRRVERNNWAMSRANEGSITLAKLSNELEGEESALGQESPASPRLPTDAEHVGSAYSLMYMPIELHSPWRRVSQLYLLKDRQREKQAEFNAECVRLANRKSADLERINEKKRRLSEIASQLQVQEPHDIAGEDSSGSFTQILNDGDEEGYENDEQERKEREEARSQSESLKPLGEAKLRGLDDMMGGTLERSKLDEYAENLEREPWMDKAKDDMTDEEVKKLKEYEERLQAYQEERERVRKALESEFRQLQSEVEHIAKHFDAAWHETFMSQQVYHRIVSQCDQTALLLCKTASLLYALQASVEEKSSMYSALEAQKSSKQVMAETLKKEQNKLGSQVDAADREVKQISSRFRKDYGSYEVYEELKSIFFNNAAPLSQKHTRFSHGRRSSEAGAPATTGSGPPIGPMSIKRRSSVASRQDKEKDGGTTTGKGRPVEEDDGEELSIGRPSVYDAFRRKSSKKRKYTTPMLSSPFRDEAEHAPLSDADKPEGLDDGVWASVLAERDERLLKETECERVSAVHQEVQIECQVAHEEAQQLKERLEHVEQQKRGEEDLLRRELHNAFLLLEMKQRNVEVDMTKPIPPFDHASLIDRGVVEQLNNQIQARGEEKVQVLERRKRERNEIIKYQWSTQEADMQLQDISDRMKELQLLRLTKNLQAHLRESAPEQKQQQQEQRLQRRIQEQHKVHNRKILQKQEGLRRTQRAIKRLQADNNSRESTVSTFSSSTQLRERMADRTSNAQAVPEHVRKMRHVRTVHKLSDVSKQQKKEIEALESELQRLHRRSRPTLPAEGGLPPI